MGLRIGTFSSFRRVLLSLRQNQSISVRAQEQLSSGRRILRPSDDPTGAARAIRIERQLSDVDRYRRAITLGRTAVETGAAALVDVSSMMAQARELVIQGMNGTYSQADRDAVATELELIRDQLIDLGNTQSGGSYLFGGTATGSTPWVVETVNGVERVRYQGNDADQIIRAGASVDVPITLSGRHVFGRFEPVDTRFGGLTGVAGGTTADQGSGYTQLTFRHDATDLGGLTAATGITAVVGGANDTFLGDNTLTVDAAAGTLQLGDGPVVSIPDPLPADLALENEKGGVLRLDLSGFTGAGFAGTVTGEGSVALSGGAFTALQFDETDLELIDDRTGTVVHVDTTGVRREGEELVEFHGTTNVFDLIGQIAADLRNRDLDSKQRLNLLNSRLDDVDRHQQNVLVGAGTLGSRGQRLDVSDERAADVEVHLSGMLSDVVDADLAEVALDLSRSDYLLQLAQAAGARVLQTTLLNYL